MLTNSKNDIKMKMLVEFEKQLDELFNNYFMKNCSFDETIRRLQNQKIVWSCFRLDLKNRGNESNDLKIFDEELDYNISFPDWFSDAKGHGCKIEGKDKRAKIKVQSINDGKLNITLRGVDYKDLENNRIPVYIDYTTLKLNEKNIFDDSKLVWHNNPFSYETECDNSQFFNLHLQFNTIFDYLPQLSMFFEDIDNDYDLYEEYKNVKFYIENEKLLLQNWDLLNIDSEPENQFATYFDNNLKILSKQYTETIKSMKSELELCKKYTDSYHELFNTLFLYYDLKPKGLLKYNHMLNQQLLDFVVNLCKKYDLNYWLDYGLLLGAVRHNGFVPWDDDLDIGMLRKDYDKLLEVIEDEINENNLTNQLKISLNIHYYKPLPILQLLYYCEEVEDTIIAGIDIFPYDFVQDISNCDNQSYKRVQKSVTTNNRNGTPIGVALEEYFNTFDIHLDEKQYLIPGVEGARGLFSGYNFTIFETADVFPLKELTFENKKYTVPNNFDVYLQKTYGDYLNIPKVIHHHQDRYNNLRRREDFSEIFEKNIDKLKIINESKF